MRICVLTCDTRVWLKANVIVCVKHSPVTLAIAWSLSAYGCKLRMGGTPRDLRSELICRGVCAMLALYICAHSQPSFIKQSSPAVLESLTHMLTIPCEQPLS